MRFVESFSGQTWGMFSDEGMWIGILRVDKTDGKIRWKVWSGNTKTPKWVDRTFNSIEEARQVIQDYYFIEKL